MLVVYTVVVVLLCTTVSVLGLFQVSKDAEKDNYSIIICFFSCYQRRFIIYKYYSKT